MAGTVLKASKKSERETEVSKKRIEQSLDVYNTLIASTPDMTLNTRGFIEAKIDLLHDELNNRPAKNKDRKVEEAIQKFQKSKAGDDTTAELKKGVKAFYKRRLYVEALDNVKLLIRQNAATEFCLIAVMGCMLHLHTKIKLAAAVDRFLVEAFQDEKIGALFKARLARKMVHTGYVEHAKVLVAESS